MLMFDEAVQVLFVSALEDSTKCRKLLPSDDGDEGRFLGRCERRDRIRRMRASCLGMSTSIADDMLPPDNVFSDVVSVVGMRVDSSFTWAVLVCVWSDLLSSINNGSF